MTTTNSTLLKDRLHAAKLLAAKVASFKDSNAIVVGVGLGGASLGISLAKELNLALQVILFQSIRHPAHPEKSIGSVSDGIVVLDDDFKDIPLDYVMGQVASLRVMIEQDYKQIYGSTPDLPFDTKPSLWLRMD
jgi:predicted phosphoribosyltransferase